MELLKERILQEGQVLSDVILKVDSFLNHQIDPMLMVAIGEEFKRRFAGEEITKVLTVEASGIAVALMTGLVLKVPVVFAKKKQATTISGNVFSGTVYSYTRQETYDIVVQDTYLKPEDKVLIIDDFLATGEASQGLVSIVEQSGAQLVGVGIVIEKLFQSGGQQLRDRGIRVESLVQIKSMHDGRVEFA
ncbi:MAG TPA: xanthine phosphoribosyltransferase [Clostridia bacterium]|nr:xanthine phosphoribosyltransferase [Clostridia bacterium]